MKTKIHVNQHVIRSNKKHGKKEPVLTVKTYKSNTYAHEVEIKGESKVIFSPDKPLSCGIHMTGASSLICLYSSKGWP